ncbi:glycosyltransferase [Solitalea lacus]|uniref:glycosyltransferase n=1 Tax=Solitalea lacus TaxID=2911172 RepID=UPI001EDA837B|nr:glycosyltransferase [Solitalea lacus]UKJ08253.1 glycosyltransferase [Solitalea lacus]
MRKGKNNTNSSVFIGNYLDESIQNERGLLAPNPAGSNRMWRMSKAVQSQGFLSYIISPACSARIKFNSKIVHPARIARKNGIIVIYAPALAIPYFSILFEFFSMAWIFLGLTFLRNIRVAMLYCYYPSTIIVGLIAKIQRIKIIEDLEDIVTPKLSDWFSKPIMFSLQQAIGGFLMRISIWLSDLIIIPSSKFLFKTIENKNYLVIDGCIDVSGDTKLNFEDEKITVLLAGMLDEEQGIDLYLQTLDIVKNNEKFAKRFKFNICGLSLNEESLKASLARFVNLDLTYYGFVSSSEFNAILKKTHVCLVLQNPTGRNAQQKTPSKGYEYMASGKAVIVTPIGDYINLPNNTCFVLSEYSPQNIISILSKINHESIIEIGGNAKQFANENWGFENIGKKIINRLF